MMDISRPLCGAQGAVEQRDAHTWGCIRYRLRGAALQVHASNPTSRTREMPTSLPIDVQTCQSHDAVPQVVACRGTQDWASLATSLSSQSGPVRRSNLNLPPCGGSKDRSLLSLFFLTAQAACANGCVYVYGVGKLSLPADRVHGG